MFQKKPITLSQLSKFWKVCSGAFCVISLCSCSFLFLQEPQKPVKAAAFIDPKRYAGTWYEIAYLPTFFQQGCRCSMLNYTLLKGNAGLVSSSCIKGGKAAIHVAKAFAVKNSHHAKQKIQMIWPFRYDYWILYVDRDYHYALTGTPNRKYLWLLSRTPTIPSSVYYALVGLAAKQGYNVGALLITQQNCSLPTQRRLLQTVHKRMNVSRR